MKFHQTMTLVILFILYATPIFGSEKAPLFHIPKAICDLIDQFRQRDIYKETDHIKPYSPTLNLPKEHFLDMLFPQKIDIRDDQNKIYIKGPINNRVLRREVRLLSDIRVKSQTHPHSPPNNFVCQGIVKRNRLTYVLNNGEITIYLSGNPNHTYLCSLSTHKKLTDFVVSKDGIVVTVGKDGVRKWELINRVAVIADEDDNHKYALPKKETLYEIMQTITDID